MRKDERFAYLSIPEVFFDSEPVKFLLSLSEGPTYLSILLYLITKVGGPDGRLSFTICGQELPMTYDQIASYVPFAKRDTVAVAIETFKKIGFVNDIDGLLRIGCPEVEVRHIGYSAQRKRVRNVSGPKVDGKWNQIGKNSTESGKEVEKIPVGFQFRSTPDKGLGVSLEDDFPVTDQVKEEVGRKEIEERNINSHTLTSYKETSNKENADLRKAAKDFYDRYPRRSVSERAVYEWFRNHDPDLSLYPDIMDGLSRWKESEDWKNEGGRYIPGPIRFLDGEKWKLFPSTGPLRADPPSGPPEEPPEDDDESGASLEELIESFYRKPEEKDKGESK